MLFIVWSQCVLLCFNCYMKKYQCSKLYIYLHADVAQRYQLCINICSAERMFISPQYGICKILLLVYRLKEIPNPPPLDCMLPFVLQITIHTCIIHSLQQEAMLNRRSYVRRKITPSLNKNRFYLNTKDFRFLIKMRLLRLIGEISYIQKSLLYLINRQFFTGLFPLTICNL